MSANEQDVVLVQRYLRRMRGMAMIAGIINGAIGILVIVGWVFDIHAFKSIFPGLVEMKPNTAVSLLLIGLALWIKSNKPSLLDTSRWVGDLCAAAAAAIALATLVEYATGVNLRLDELLFHDPYTPTAQHPGRMAPVSAVCISCLAISVMLLDEAPKFSLVLTGVSMAFSLLALLGYAYGVQPLYRMGAYSSVALHTAAALFISSLGMLLARPHRPGVRLFASNTSGGSIARGLLPATLLVPPIVGWIRLQGQRAGYYGTELGLSLFTLSSVIILTSMVWWNASMLDGADQRRRKLEADRDDLLARETAARARAETAILARDQFLSIVSHELRTPLTPILLVATALENRAQLPSDVCGDLTMIREQIQIEARLIDDLLNLASLRQGKLSLNCQLVDMHELAQTTASLFAAAFQEKGVDLALQLAAKSSTVWGDPVRLKQVIWNLIGNALKFTPCGGHVLLRTFDPSGGQFAFELIDTGVGIKAGAIGRIFDAFEQGDASTTRQFGGMGIGLTICKMIVEMHSGTIQASSPGPNSGATFRVELPACTKVVSSPEIPVRPGKAAQKLKILVVEDNPDTLKAMERILEALGHEVLMANSAEKALAIARSEPFDLLISDIGLPDVSGWELMPRLREVRAVPAIALSGFMTDDDRRRSLEAGFFRHLGKPVEVASLAKAIDEARTEAATRVSGSISLS